MTRCLLIVTSQPDVHADAVVEHFTALHPGFDVFRLNTERFLLDHRVSFDGAHFLIDNVLNGKCLASKNEMVVWYRRPSEIQVDQELSVADAKFVRSESSGVLSGLIYHLHNQQNVWINDLLAMRRWRWTACQLALALDLGLSVPNTRIANFVVETSEIRPPLCIKSINTPVFETHETMVSVYTTRVQASELHREPDFLNFTLVQEYVEKQYDIRVVVFGASVFAFRIDSQDNALSQIDFRGFNPFELAHSLITLDQEVERKLLALVAAMGLRFAAIDLVMDQDSKVTFLEVNPNGQWLWLEKVTGVPLVESFANYVLTCKA